MTAPNRNVFWAETFVDELAAGGLSAVCLSPGSRSTPLTTAFDAHPDVDCFSILDERSAGFFALGRGRRHGEPTALVCTSGTAAANYHPAIIEADQSGVPLLVLTADRPPELIDSGANQTVDQEKLYGDAVRWYRDLPEPEAEPRKVRMLRTTAARALANTTGADPGPVHLNVRFRKPLEPTEVPGDVPESFAGDEPLAAEGRAGPFVRTRRGRSTPTDADASALATAVDDASRPLFVVGPSDPGRVPVDDLATLAARLDAPVLADPLSQARFGPHVPSAPVCGGYDSYLAGTGEWPDPDLVVRFGASPTSKVLRQYLHDAAARQLIVDPAGGWTEAEFTATDLLEADPAAVVDALSARVTEGGEPAWRDRFERAEREYWDVVSDARAKEFFEGDVLATVLEDAPDPATLFVSNSMPVRDADRFGCPRSADLTVLGNRGASGIDGITSTALGAGSATDDPLVLVTGDLAYYHDMNGLLSVARCGVDATIVLVNNDGGGIFHQLPIEQFDPPFTGQFKTPHGLDFEPSAELYDLGFARVDDADSFRDAYRDSVSSDGTQVLAVRLDGEESHRYRDAVHERVCEKIRSDDSH
ncbi:2-succinyl-5-enolpyruvyl-6-hydroxy-3-cyclohexene-1-carboxylic-acid synthase [Haloarculaceae archaeon H-GB2-1]|nr:2-succinyl-5-enolpyruvyl-6-hydroxy-3-cyclohexene-1-carboxylic-acid synthase [Haloarculaceae archaeon H-GB1-1]MEA5386007.1 2-succinyl-5-enolpyruvyl-6-hydroxy-3-cyclohexene-1-carboxylic-acid synthase [Haloarculaceae archaeon H-GB11]MEA5407511.1 2-succinyl-5-enolpyruvyl-6-hydroxy-3-cyclohexene-1-carboxylic-acid synthase [Haloarculaceae archaeon H-GB2-1]